MRCTSCGTTNKASAEQCERCGARLPDTSTTVSDAEDFDAAATVLGSIDAILVATEGRQKYALRPISVVGRLSSCTIVVDNSSVSREHAKLTKVVTGHLIEDLGSANGTYVNGERVTTSVLLRPDDLVKIGSVEFRYEADEPASPVGSAASSESTTSASIKEGSFFRPSVDDPNDARTTLQADSDSDSSVQGEPVPEFAAPESDASHEPVGEATPQGDASENEQGPRSDSDPNVDDAARTKVAMRWQEPVETYEPEPAIRSSMAVEGSGQELGESAAVSQALEGVARIEALVGEIGRQQREIETETRSIETNLRILAPAANLQRHVSGVIAEAHASLLSTENVQELEALMQTVVRHPRDIDALRAISDRAADVAQVLTGYRRLHEAVDSLKKLLP